MQDRDLNPPPAGLPDLDALFAEARSHAPEPSDALMARVLADALAAQPTPAAFAVAVPPPPRGLLTRLADLFGGMGALAGVGGAAVAGLFLGFVQPSGLSSFSAALTGGQIDSLSLVASVDDLFAEEAP